jgi:hypothetical protein
MLARTQGLDLSLDVAVLGGARGAIRRSTQEFKCFGKFRL